MTLDTTENINSVPLNVDNIECEDDNIEVFSDNQNHSIVMYLDPNSVTI